MESKPVLPGKNRLRAAPGRSGIRFAIVLGRKFLASTGVDNDITPVSYTFLDRFILAGIIFIWLGILGYRRNRLPNFTACFGFTGDWRSIFHPG
jgi:hypothetical protein